ncbi:MAG TPA: NUDIX hydrolase [Bacteroidales bacterium]|nr:NUDIX hydrolase [Bacteroidales bacterium]
MSFCYDYPRPAVTADCVLFSHNNDDLNVLLIRRGNEPYKDKWAIPGGFIQMDETLEQGAIRELAEETGIENVHLMQLRTFSAVDRDPRGRTISVVFYTVIKSEDYTIKAGDDAADIKWFSTENLPELAFDHSQILKAALDKVRE